MWNKFQTATYNTNQHLHQHQDTTRMDPTNATTQIKLMDIMSHDSVSTLFGVSLLTDIWGDAVRSHIIINIWFWGKKILDTFSMILIFLCVFILDGLSVSFVCVSDANSFNFTALFNHKLGQNNSRKLAWNQNKANVFFAIFLLSGQ